MAKSFLPQPLGFFLGGGNLKQGFVSEVKAAQPPSVFNITVSASKDGIRAGCDFFGYRDKNEYILQLYLTKVEEDGLVSEVASMELEADASGEGAGQTPWAHVETGVYKASAAIKKYEGGNLTETVFTDSAFYRVVKDKDSYIVEPCQMEPESGPQTGGTSREKDSEKVLRGDESGREYPPCGHDRVFDIIQEADPKQDALMEERCAKCGEIFSFCYVPNSAYAAFLKESARAVLNAKEEKILIVTDRWMSFNREVLDAISARPDVTVTIHYRYGGKQWEVTVPAGTDAQALADENGYCGFRCMQGLYSGEEVFL